MQVRIRRFQVGGRPEVGYRALGAITRRQKIAHQAWYVLHYTDRHTEMPYIIEK